MKYECPQCKQQIYNNKELRYLGSHYREIFNTVHSKLYRFHCPNRLKDTHELCNHKFLVKIEFPLDPTLAPSISVSYNWGAWNQAKTKKPGAVCMGTTSGEFTDFVHRDTSGIYHIILGKYFPEKLLVAQ